MADQAEANQGATKKTPRRSRGHSSEVSPAIAILSFLCVLGLAILMIVLSQSTRVGGTQHINGDFLGPQGWENGNPEAYAQRADETLADRAAESAEVSDGNPLGPKLHFWALASFDTRQDSATVARAVDDIAGLRVATALVGTMSSRDLPEPIDGASHQEVLDQELAVAASSAQVPLDSPDLLINGLVVYGTIDQLQRLREQDSIIAVEALPADASRGRFGIRPLYVAEN